MMKFFYLNSITPDTGSSGIPAKNTIERRQGNLASSFPCFHLYLRQGAGKPCPRLPSCGYIYELQDPEGR